VSQWVCYAPPADCSGGRLTNVTLVLRNESSENVHDDSDIPSVLMNNKLSPFNDLNSRTSAHPLEQQQKSIARGPSNQEIAALSLNDWTIRPSSGQCWPQQRRTDKNRVWSGNHIAAFPLRFLIRFVSTFNSPTSLNQTNHHMPWPISFDLLLRLRNSVCDQLSWFLFRFSSNLLIPSVRVRLLQTSTSCHGAIARCANPGRRPRGGATARGCPRSRCPTKRFRSHSPISVRNFAFAAHVRPVMQESSLSVRQEQVFNKTLRANEYGTEFNGVARDWGVEDIERASGIRRYKAHKLETDALTRLWNRKSFLLLLIDCSMVWYLRAIRNGSALALSCERVDRIRHHEDVRGRFSCKRVIVKRRNHVNGVIEYMWSAPFEPQVSDGESLRRPAAGQRNCWMTTDQLNSKAQYRLPMAFPACLDYSAVLPFLSLFLFTFLTFLFCPFCRFVFLCFMPLCSPLVSVNSFFCPFYLLFSLVFASLSSFSFSFALLFLSSFVSLALFCLFVFVCVLLPHPHSLLTYGCSRSWRSNASVDRNWRASFYSLNSWHESMFEMLTSHDRGNASPAMNRTLFGSETEWRHVPAKAVDSIRDNELDSNKIDESDWQE
jgi:hypothetical protein